MPSDLARPKRTETAGHRSTVPLRAGLAAVLVVGVLVAVIALPAFAFDGGGDEADRAGGAPATSTSTTSTTAPATPPTTAAVEAVTAAFTSLTDEERLALELFFMSDAEREAFARFVAPPPPPPPPAPEPEPAPFEVVPVEPAPVEAAPAGSVWDELAYCETGGNWAHPPVGSYGYSGGLMFLPSTWNAYGGGEFASQAYLASRDAQIVVAERILASHGGSYRAWPGCRAKLGLP